MHADRFILAGGRLGQGVEVRRVHRGSCLRLILLPQQVLAGAGISVSTNRVCARPWGVINARIVSTEPAWRTRSYP